MEHFRKLFAYDEWATGRHLDSLVAASSIPPPALRAFGHLVAAKRIWLMRVDASHPTTASFYAERTLEECTALMHEGNTLWQEKLATLGDDDLLTPVDYRDSFGDPYSAHLRDILMQVLLHSAHHRGQVALALRQAGETPADADLYIAPRVEP